MSESTKKLLTEVPPTAEEGQLLTEVPTDIEGELLTESLSEQTSLALEDHFNVGDLSTGAVLFIDGPVVKPNRRRKPKAEKERKQKPKKEKPLPAPEPVREYTPQERKKLLQNYSKRTLQARFGIKL